jgi:hypothetical protein
MENPMNNLLLKATRQGLGLTVAEASELPPINVQKRTFQYFEAGERAIPDYVDLTFFTMSSHYNLVLEKMLVDIEKATIYPGDDEIKPTIKPVLPFFQTFEMFQMATECPHIVYWRIYQSVISHLVLIGKITKLDDSKRIPDGFEIWKWLQGQFEAT